MSPRLDALRGDLGRAHDGDAWFGSSLAELLGDVTAEEAAARPVAGAHSIWEVVLHVTGWTREVTRRLDASGPAPALPAEGDWPEVSAVTADPAGAWEAARRALVEASARLLDTLAAFPEARLDQPVGGPRDRELGSGIPFHRMLSGLAQHHAYHAGQIAILRKAARQPR